MTDYRTRLEAFAGGAAAVAVWPMRIADYGDRALSVTILDTATMATDLRSLLSEADRLRALVNEAEKVVEPFGLAGGSLSSRWQGHETHWQIALSYPLTVASLRAARSLLTKLKGED